MKRCPQCQFIYPDADRVCDFDQAPLVEATESEIAAITNTPERPALPDVASTHSLKFEKRKNKRTLPIAAAIGLLLGITTVVVYVAVHRQMRSQPAQDQAQKASTSPVAQLSYPSPSPSINSSPTPSPDVASPEKSASPGAKTTAHTKTNSGPVSPTAPGTTSKANTKKVILLTSGGKVEADEVWRTKEGVWYRIDGVVTLLKKNRVKAIVNQ
jgi:cytoskeletal protein RodZ